MSRYAEKTEVPQERSRQEIERTLVRYGAEEFIYGWKQAERVAMVGFRMRGLLVRLTLSMPDPKDREFTHTKTHLIRSENSARESYEQACRQRWRALALVVKAKLEAIEAGISTFEQEFLAFVLLPDNQTVGQWVGPQIRHVYETREMPALLPGLDARALPEHGEP